MACEDGLSVTHGVSPRRSLDEQVDAWATGKSWLAASLVAWEIDVIVVELDDQVRSGLRAAQARQRMVNRAHR
jgi:hypothetical protein